MMVIREEANKQVVVEGCGVVGGEAGWLVGWWLMVVDVHMLLILFVLVVMIILRGCAKQVVVEGGGVVGLLVGEELTKEARLYKMLITPTTKALVVFWKRPRKAGEPKWFTKGPRQFTIVYRTFDRLPPPGFHQLCV